MFMKRIGMFAGYVLKLGILMIINALLSDYQRKTSTSAREEIFKLVRRLINFLNERKATAE
jgi:hypothetical protein